MSDSACSTAQLVADLRRLERQVRRLHTLLLGSALSVCVFAAVAFTTRRSAEQTDSVTTKRLVLVDANGAPGATFDLASQPQYDAVRPPWVRTSLRITVDDSRTDSARNFPDSVYERLRGHAAVVLGGEGLMVTVSSPRSVADRESGLRLEPGPTLQLTRGDQSVYRIEPTKGVRPVLDRAQ